MSKTLSLPQFNAAVDEVAGLQNQIARLEAERDRRELQIQAEYNAQINAHEAKIKANLAACEDFAVENRESLFEGATKSAETDLAIFGFAFSPEALKTMAKVTWAKVLERLIERDAKVFVNLRPTVDKEALRKADSEFLREIGCRLEQRETFFIRAKLEEADRLTPARQ